MACIRRLSLCIGKWISKLVGTYNRPIILYYRNSILWMIKALNQISYSKEYVCIDYKTVVYANVKFRLSCTMT